MYYPSRDKIGRYTRNSRSLLGRILSYPFRVTWQAFKALKWQRKALLLFIGTLAAFPAFNAVAPLFTPVTLVYQRVYADTVETPFQMKTIPEKLQAIADCESGERKPDGSAVEGSAKQFYADGRVVRNYNKDGSVDLGWAQINTVHYAKVMRLEIDIHSLEGNQEFARILYESEGTQPWYSSRKCWDR